jgi:hypothetical protein
LMADFRAGVAVQALPSWGIIPNSVGLDAALGIKRDLGRDPRVNRSGLAGFVDYVADFTVIAKSHRDHMVEPHVRCLRHLDGAGQHDVWTQKDAINSKAPSLVAGHIVRDFVRSPAVGSGCTRVTNLIGWIVGNLGLVEIGSSVISIPKHLELLMMFYEQAISSDVIPVDDEAVGAGIAGPTHTRPVIGAPDPGVINNGIAAVDFKIDQRAPHSSPADAKENIMKRNRIPNMPCFAASWSHL